MFVQNLQFCIGIIQFAYLAKYLTFMLLENQSGLLMTSQG